jgi:hypothetical protein
MRHLSFWSVACGVAVLALAGCGDDKTTAEHDKSVTKSSSVPSAPATSDPAMNVKRVPGQAGQVEQTLTAAGFECTRHADHAIDLRLCSKGYKQPERGQFGGPSLVGGNLRFYAAPDGTVLFAKVEATGDTGAQEWTQMRLQMLKSVLPAQDASVVAADGDKLTWGAYVADPSHSTSDGWLMAKGFEPTRPQPVEKPMSITKEQALTKFSAAQFKLKCSFGDPASYQSEDHILSCYDNSSDSSTTENPSATIEVEDTGSGITGIILQARQDKTATNLQGIKNTAPKLAALGDTTLVPAFRDWLGKHLDGLPHTAYVGDHVASVSVTDQSLTGPQVYVGAAFEQPLLGYDPSKIDGN